MRYKVNKHSLDGVLYQCGRHPCLLLVYCAGEGIGVPLIFGEKGGGISDLMEVLKLVVGFYKTPESLF